MPVVYLAGPIDYATDNGVGWRNELKKAAKSEDSNISFFDPTAPYSFTIPNNDIAKFLFEINMGALHRSQLVLAKLPKGTPVVGTPIEVYEAYNLKIPIILMTDMDNSLTLRYFATNHALVRVLPLDMSYTRIVSAIEVFLSEAIHE